MHKDFTPQEELTAELLTSFGIRFEQQWSVPGTNYSADFYIEELMMVLECDGPIGHLKKADAERTINILASAPHMVSQVARVDAMTKTGLREQIWQVLMELEGSYQNENP